jgi:Cysteine-rich secretory protein family
MPVKPTKKHHHVPGHKHTKDYVKTYWPYLPLLLVVFVGLFFGGNPTATRQGVLAYATEMSSGGLLSSTNAQRSAAGAASLSINSQLTSAAQSKANDMIARNYWSHNTPDGKEPWVFFQNAGYQYSKAGENLAYGFLTSSETVTGWMNSPSHKANMLDTAFTEVGFGIANGENFNASGASTVVVAMYGKPQVLASTTPTPAPTTKKAKTSITPTPAATPTPAPAAAPAPAPAPEPEEKIQLNIPNSLATGLTVNSVAISRAQLITKGAVPWITFALGLVSGLAVVVLLTRHGLALRHMLRDSERFVAHHPLLDGLVVGIIVLSIILIQTKGVIL